MDPTAAAWWWMPSPGPATWIAYEAADTLGRVLLLTDDSRLRSPADPAG